MADDKQIFELPSATLSQLRDAVASGKRIAFLAQIEGFNLDFAIEDEVLAGFLGIGAQLNVYGGTNSPAKGAGKTGDIYVQENGTVYQKGTTDWDSKVILKLGVGAMPAATLQVNPGSDPVAVNVPNGYSYLKCEVYLPNGQASPDRKFLDFGSQKLSVNTLGDTLTLVFF